MLQQLPFGLEWLVVVTGGMMWCLYLTMWYIQSRKLRRQKPAPAAKPDIASPKKDRNAYNSMLPQNTPHRHVLNKRDVWTKHDLAAYKTLTDIAYIGEKRAEAIAEYLAPKLDTSKKDAWPEEIQSRM